MKPKPFCELKNLTVPVAILASSKTHKCVWIAQPFARPHIRIWRVLGKGPSRGQMQGRQNLERGTYRAGTLDLQRRSGDAHLRAVPIQLMSTISASDCPARMMSPTSLPNN